MASVKEKVHALIRNITYAESLEEDFCGFFLVPPEEEEKLRKAMRENVKQFWSSIPQEAWDVALKCYVSCFHKQANSQRAKLLLNMLELLVECNIVPARSICDALLRSEDLDHQLSDKWCQTFSMVRRVVGGIDYKGCRDILHVMLEKSKSITDIGSMSVVDAIAQVVQYILDRNTCLLPSYYAVYEITRLCADKRFSPHWRLGQLLADFVQTFRPTAGLVTVAGRCSLLPIVGHSSVSANVWKLNPKSLSFNLNGPLPYNKDLQEPQIALLCYVLKQPFSRDMVCSMLGLKQGMLSAELEEQLENLVMLAMERSEAGDADDAAVAADNLALWHHLSSQLIFFVLCQYTSFPNFVHGLYNKLKKRMLRKGRDHLMWVLLQFISGSIQKNMLEEFLPVIQLYDLLYPDGEMLDVPDVGDDDAILRMAAICIWIHLGKKAQNDKRRLERAMPHALRRHMDFLKQCLQTQNLSMIDYRITLLCNAYSTNTDIFAMPIGVLIDGIYGNSVQPSFVELPGKVQALSPTEPIPMSKIDLLTVHVKMSLIHGIVTRVIRLAKAQTNMALAPALVETYSRLLVCKEIETLGIKGFISQLLPSVCSSNAWGVLHTLLEMFSYRLHHIQPHYRVQLLHSLHSLSASPQISHNQLHLSIESTALRLIMGLGSWEVHPQLPRIFSEAKTSSLLSSDSEELNKALVLTLARSMYITGYEASSSWNKDSTTWWQDTLLAILRQTPHGWPSHTLACFPTALAEFYRMHPPPKDDHAALKRSVEAEYRKWKSMASENDLVAHFLTPGNPPLFLCVLWRSLLEDNHIAPTAYKVLERLGPRALSTHLRTFSDYLVYEFAISPGGQHFNKRVDSLNDLIWRCNVVPIDRLVLCLALRNLEGKEAQVCFLIIRFLLLKTSDFRNRVHDFINDNSPDHWLQSDWHEKHMAFHMKYPEKFYFEGLQDVNQPSQHAYLPIYFGNVCLRFLPVFDIVIHRVLELPDTEFLEIMLENLGGLYKFHDRPVTYLYNTLHYYDHKLRDRPLLKKKLVQWIIGSQSGIRPSNWCLSPDYLEYLNLPAELDDTPWIPDQNYYKKLTKRLVDTMAGHSPFPSCDWRFNEFPNSAMHALHATCVELMALPVGSHVVGGALLDIVMKGAMQIPSDSLMPWINAIGLILTTLPETFCAVLHSRIVDVLQSPPLVNPSANCRPFITFNFSACQQVAGESAVSHLIALCHSVWHHCSIGQLSCIPQFVREQLKPLVRREYQLLFVCHLVGPFFQRFHFERARYLVELTIELYEMLAAVDKNSSHLFYMDQISDFLYHIKYMFTGNSVKNQVERIIPTLRPALRLRLRFISHQLQEEIAPS